MLTEVDNSGMASSQIDTVGQHNFQDSHIHLVSHRFHYADREADTQLKHFKLFKLQLPHGILLINALCEN